MHWRDKLQLAARVIAMRWHDRWSRPRLLRFQQKRLVRLLRFAKARSPYYRRTLAGLEDAGLAELPILGKRDLVEHWDELVTVPDLRLAELLRFLDRPPAVAERYAERYQVMATSGTTGLRAVFCYAPEEWLEVNASAARLTAWRDGAGPSPHDRLALVLLPGGAVPPPMGARMAATLSRFFPGTTLIDASRPTAEIVAALQACQPTLLAGYAGTLALLAEEQRAGRLQIAPRLIQSSSEVLDSTMHARIREAFGVEPHNSYAMTEAGMVAGTCALGRGLHLQEDSVILENVDEVGRPVPPGRFGSRVLLTVLWSRTLPLIRYEVSDRVRFAEAPCPCGRPYATIEAIDGRAGDVLALPGRNGSPVHLTPSQIQRLLGDWPVASWQLHYRPGRLRIDVVPLAGASLDPMAAAAAMRRALAEAGCEEIGAVAVESVERIAAGPSGKVARFLIQPNPILATNG
jgi:phenylacetate-CoA ligase